MNETNELLRSLIAAHIMAMATEIQKEVITLRPRTFVGKELDITAPPKMGRKEALLKAVKQFKEDEATILSLLS